MALISLRMAASAFSFFTMAVQARLVKIHVPGKPVTTRLLSAFSLLRWQMRMGTSLSARRSQRPSRRRDRFSSVGLTSSVNSPSVL
jgi:hypothetical protein